MKDNLSKIANIKTFTMSDIDKLGIKEVIENTIEYLKSRNVDGVHLSLDVDALDRLKRQALVLEFWVVLVIEKAILHWNYCINHI